MTVSLPNTEQHSSELLHRSGLIAPPTDLDVVTSLWPRLSVIEEDLDGAGYLLDLGIQGVEIIIKRTDNLPRKRFTIAHEIGHLVLRSEQPEQSGISTTSPQIERWCDAFGASLLIPRKWLLDYLMSGSLGQLGLRILRGPSAFNVSSETFRLRVAELTDVSVFEICKREEGWDIDRSYLSPVLTTEVADEAFRRLMTTAVRRGEHGIYIDNELNLILSVVETDRRPFGNRRLLLMKPR